MEGEHDTSPEDELPRLVKGTYNHPPTAAEALTKLTRTWRMTKTDALNRALLLAATMQEIAPGEHLKLERPDGTKVEIYFI